FRRTPKREPPGVWKGSIRGRGRLPSPAPFVCDGAQGSAEPQRRSCKEHRARPRSVRRRLQLGQRDSLAGGQGLQRDGRAEPVN
ncbi:hypothetical protein C1Y23_35075, partial [Pseudomonas sp. GW460-12]